MPIEDAANDASLDIAARASRGALKEFVVEFLGGLIPGVAFLLAITPALILPVAKAIHFVFPSYDILLPVFGASESLTIGLVLFFVIPALFAFLVFAYIAGHLFYRLDPKVADHASFLRIPRHKSQDGMVRAVEGGDIPIEFPYHFLQEYLAARGIDYLAKRVPWGPGNFQRRAKHFANALKIRILVESPHNFGLLARNEGHIRLSSSMWYVCRVLLGSSIIGLFAFFGTIIMTHLSGSLPSVKVTPHFVAPLLVFAFSWLGKWAIERALHYQREREILFILETAHWLCISGRAPKIFDGLNPEDTNVSTDR